MAQASPSWQRLMGLLSVLLALLFGLSAEKNGAAAAGCPADVSAPDNTWSVDFDNRTDVSETHGESSYVESLKAEFEKLEATGLHGLGAQSGFEDSTVQIPASCLNEPANANNKNSAPLALPVSLASLHLRTVQTWASYM